MPAVARGVLRADHGAKVKGQVGNEVGEKPQAIDEREVDGGARGGLAPRVEDGLRVEGGGPAYCVDPAKEAREDREEAYDHCYWLTYIVRAIRVEGR